MEEKTGSEALNVVIERLSEICSKTPHTEDVDNRSVGSQTPAVSVVPVQVNTIKSHNPASLPKSSPSKKETFKCDECDYSSHNKHYLKQHVDLVHSTDRPFKCPFCDYAGKRSYALKEHLIVHSNDRPFECTHCNATFRKKGHLTNHIKMHASQWNFDCSICHTSFPTRDALYAHVGKHASDEGDVFACEQCLFVTLDKSLMCKHIENVTCSDASKTLKCDFDRCNFTTSKEEELASHRDTHNIRMSNTSPTVLLKCSECGFTSTEQEVLENHIINKHLNNMSLNISESISKSLHPPTAPKNRVQNVYTQPTVPPKSKNCEQMLCKICGFTSKDAQGLVQHMKSHNATQINQKRLIPNQSENTCLNPDSAKFSYDAALRIFRCSICGYTCEHQRTIKSHIWKHSGHKDVGYPMFQNGPLSIYDDQQAGMKTQDLAKMNIVTQPKGGIPINASVVMNAQDTKPVPVSTFLNLTATSSSFPGATVSSAIGTRARGIPILRDIRVSQAPNTSSASTSHPVNSGNTALSELLKPQSMVVVPTSELLIEQEYQSPVESLAVQPNAALPGQFENGLNIISRIASTQDVLPDYPCAQLVVLNVDQTQLQHVLSEADVSNVVIVNQDVEEEKESHPEIISKRKHEDLNNDEDEDETNAKRSRHDFEASEIGSNVVVENVQDSCSVADLSLRESPRVAVSEAVSDASSVRSEGVSPVPTDVTLVEPATESHDDVETPVSDDQLTQSLVSACEKAERAIVNTKTSDAKRQRSDEPDGVAISEQDILDVTSKASSVTRCTRSSSGTSRQLRSSNKSGISSSLLAVIEQLRERSKSDSDHEESEPPPCPPKVQPASRVTKRSRSKRSSTDEPVDIESYQNVEKLEHEAGTYRCKLCHYKSSSTTLMVQHMRLHKSKKPFECSLCDFIAEASEALQDHMLQHCKIRTYQCKLCPSTFNYKSQLRAHMRAHNETEPFTCDVCEFETFNPILFRNHAKTHKESKDYHCKNCNAAYTEKCEDENHQREERSAGNLYCDECGLVLQSQDDLKKHQKSHIKQLRCEQCSFSCSTLGRMRNHCRLHLDDKPMQCNLCDFTAISTRSLKSHMKRHINDQRYVQQPLEQYKCNLCGYVCHHLPSLKSHMWRHASETGYSYQDANDAINAAIDYENNMSQPIKSKSEVAVSREDSDDDTDVDTENVQVIEHVKELLDTQKVVKVDLTREGKSDGSTLVTFRCCQCGFESISRVQLTSHMKQHADIISKTLEISQYNNHKKGAPLQAVEDVNDRK